MEGRAHSGDREVCDCWILLLNGGWGRKAEVAGEPVLKEVGQQAGKRALPSALTWTCGAGPSQHPGAWLVSSLPSLPVPGTGLGTCEGLQEYLWNEWLFPKFSTFLRHQFKKK